VGKARGFIRRETGFYSAVAKYRKHKVVALRRVYVSVPSNDISGEKGAEESMASSEGLNLFAGRGVVLRFFGVAVALYTIRSNTTSVVARFFLGYASSCLMLIACLVYTKEGGWVIGKDTKTGQIPTWSFFVWWPFHAMNRILAKLASRRNGVEPATEVYPNFYVGGWHSFELGIKWAAVVDLCCELPERCETEQYVCFPTWDGVVKAKDVAEAAVLLAAASKRGPVCIHCAHGVGRSTTVCCAALVEAGHFPDTASAFVHCKQKRPVVKTSPHFRQVLAEWKELRSRGL
jgi:protein-tyrosine phosphatase